MDERLKNARNVAIVLAIAVAVAFLPGGSRVAETASTVIGIAFAAAFACAGVWFYRRRRMDLYGLGESRRALLYGALGVGMLTLAAKTRMWETGFGELLWFVLIALVLYTLFALYRYTRSY